MSLFQGYQQIAEMIIKEYAGMGKIYYLIPDRLFLPLRTVVYKTSNQVIHDKDPLDLFLPIIQILLEDDNQGFDFLSFLIFRSFSLNLKSQEAMIKIFSGFLNHTDPNRLQIFLKKFSVVYLKDEEKRLIVCQFLERVFQELFEKTKKGKWAYYKVLFQFSNAPFGKSSDINKKMYEFDFLSSHLDLLNDEDFENNQTDFFLKEKIFFLAQISRCYFMKQDFLNTCFYLYRLQQAFDELKVKEEQDYFIGFLIDYHLCLVFGYENDPKKMTEFISKMKKSFSILSDKGISHLMKRNRRQRVSFYDNFLSLDWVIEMIAKIEDSKNFEVFIINHIFKEVLSRNSKDAHLVDLNGVFEEYMAFLSEFLKKLKTENKHDDMTEYYYLFFNRIINYCVLLFENEENMQLILGYFKCFVDFTEANFNDPAFMIVKSEHTYSIEYMVGFYPVEIYGLIGRLFFHRNDLEQAREFSLIAKNKLNAFLKKVPHQYSCYPLFLQYKLLLNNKIALIEKLTGNNHKSFESYKESAEIASTLDFSDFRENECLYQAGLSHLEYSKEVLNKKECVRSVFLGAVRSLFLSALFFKRSFRQSHQDSQRKSYDESLSRILNHNFENYEQLLMSQHSDGIVVLDLLSYRFVFDYFRYHFLQNVMREHEVYLLINKDSVIKVIADIISRIANSRVSIFTGIIKELFFSIKPEYSDSIKHILRQIKTECFRDKSVSEKKRLEIFFDQCFENSTIDCS